MLVIQRRKGEGIRIGEAILVKVLETGQGRVKLGIEAPAGLQIARDELPVSNRQVEGPEND